MHTNHWPAVAFTSAFRNTWTDAHEAMYKHIVLAHSETRRIVKLRKQRKRNVQQRRVALKKRKARLPVRSRDNEHQDDYLRRFPCNHVYSKQCTTTFTLFWGLHIVPSRRNSKGAIVRTIVERKRQHVYPLSLCNQRGEMHCQRQNQLAKGSAERNDRIKWLCGGLSLSSQK